MRPGLHKGQALDLLQILLTSGNIILEDHMNIWHPIFRADGKAKQAFDFQHRADSVHKIDFDPPAEACVPAHVKSVLKR